MSDAKRARRAGLGRGLNALLGDIARESAGRARRSASATGVRMLPVSALAPHPDQPRRHFDDAALDELAASIAARGLIQPIVVRPHGHDYQIVAGERRWRAAQRARLHEVPVVVRELDDAETLEIALVENIQRAGSQRDRRGEAYQRLVERVRPHAGSARQDRPQVAQPRRQPAATARSARAGAGARRRRRADDGPCARAASARRDVEALAEQVVARGPVGARDRDSWRATPSRGQARAAARSRDARRRCRYRRARAAARRPARAARCGSAIGEKGGTLTLDYSTLDQLDMVCQRLSGERDLAATLGADAARDRRRTSCSASTSPAFAAAIDRALGARGRGRARARASRGDQRRSARAVRAFLAEEDAVALHHRVDRARRASTSARISASAISRRASARSHGIGDTPASSSRASSIAQRRAACPSITASIACAHLGLAQIGADRVERGLVERRAGRSGAASRYSASFSISRAITARSPPAAVASRARGVAGEAQAVLARDRRRDPLGVARRSARSRRTPSRAGESIASLTSLAVALTAGAIATTGLPARSAASSSVDRLEAFLADAGDADVARAAEQRQRRRLVGQPRRVALQRRAVEVDPLGLRPHRARQPRGELRRAGLVGAVEQDTAGCRAGGAVERRADLRRRSPSRRRRRASAARRARRARRSGRRRSPTAARARCSRPRSWHIRSRPRRSRRPTRRSRRARTAPSPRSTSW